MASSSISPGTPTNGGNTSGGNVTPNQRIPKRAANAETILVDASNLTMIDGLNINAKEWVKWRSGTEAKCRSTSPESHPDIVRNGITPDGLMTGDVNGGEGYHDTRLLQLLTRLISLEGVLFTYTRTQITRLIPVLAYRAPLIQVCSIFIHNPNCKPNSPVIQT